MFDHQLSTVAAIWVASGAVMGGLFSGARKTVNILREPNRQYRNELIEVPIRGVYHLSRIAAHTGWGSVIGGSAAISAPVSMPLYFWWMSREQQVSDNSDQSSTVQPPSEKPDIKP